MGFKKNEDLIVEGIIKENFPYLMVYVEIKEAC